jgi:PKD repeat protein/flagellar hook assembly protein FlgD
MSATSAPTADEQEDTVTVSYCLGQSANITSTVTDETGTRVRTLEDAVSHAGNSQCSNNQVTWDGKNDAGKVVADGVYTLRLHAVDGTGATGDATARLGVDTRTPGTLTSPAPGDTVSDTVNWVFTPTAGFQLRSVSVSCEGGFLGSSAVAAADGTFRGSGDSSGCRSGSNKLTASANWTDPFDVQHSWTAPAVAVTVRNPPVFTIASGSERYFSPNGDEQEDTTTVYYCLSEAARVTATVTDGSGSLVRALDSADVPGTPGCWSFWNTVTWDGKDDAGKVVADGVYRLRLHAVDGAGQSGDASSRLGVDTRTPGALTSPKAGETVAGSVKWVFAPTDGFELDSVTVGCHSGNGLGATSNAPVEDGTFTGTLDTTNCTGGDNKLDAWASWRDPFGQLHSWLAPAVTVTVGNPPRLSVPSWSERYFSPNGDSQEDTATVGYCLSAAADLDATVVDGDGTKVRTLESGVSHTGSPNCEGSWNHTVEWDGKDDAGEVVADGAYRLRLHAVDGAGQSGDASSRLGVETRTPGALTSPAAGDTVSGSVRWVFTPTEGFGLNSVTVGCHSGNGLGSTSTTPAGDGTFVGTLDSTNCASGDNKLDAWASWYDPFNQSHSWSAPAVAVTVGNPPRLSVPSWSERYFSPNGDSQEDTATFYYCLSAAADVDVTVVDADGAKVRTLESGVSHTGSLNCEGSYNHSLTWDGKDDAGEVVADGVYTLRLHAVDGAGQSGDASSRLGVDTRTPGALTTPAAGDTLAGLATFAFQPTSGFPVDQVDLNFDTGGGTSIHNASPDGVWRTSMYTGSLKNGAAVLHQAIAYTDPFGVTHTWTGPDTPVVIDVTTLPLTATADPATGPAPLATTFRIDTSDPQARTVHYTINFGDRTAIAEGDVGSPYATIEVAHTYASPGAYRAVVTVTNSAGASSTRAVDITATGGINTAPTAGLTLDATSGVVPLPVLATVTGSDADGDALTWSLDFGDGSALTKGSLPHDPVGHTYDKAGTYLVRLVVSDGKLTTVKTATVVVGLAEPLAASAGDDQVTVVNTAVHLDGGSSRPTEGIEAYHWDFGDGGGADGVAVDHAYTTAGTYTATLTVTADGHSDKDSAVITVGQSIQSGLVISVHDEGGTAVAGAELVVIAGSGERYSATTDDTGHGHLQALPDGSYTIYAWKQGYLPAKATGTVSGNAGSASVTLKAGQVATASLASTPMTYDQIVAAGIDPDDPANQHVYEFKINLAFETDGPTAQVSGYAASGGFPLCPQVTGAEVTCESSGSGASFTTETYHISVSVNYVHDQPQLVWLVIPGKASWLKEFFSVQMMVSNLAEPDFTLDHGSATLSIPDGLTLAPTAAGQSATIPMDDIPGGRSATATWILRGDTEGFYDLTASYAGSLDPFGDTVTVRAATDKPLHVWGGSALQLTVDADDTASERYPYRVTVGLKNVADVPVYNPTIELLKEGKKNYIYQPREQLVLATADLAPGETLKRDWILVPTISGTLDLSKSFVSKTAGDVELPWKVTSHPADNPPDQAPEIQAFGLKDKVGLTWEPVPRATEYQVFTTPDPETDFPPHPASGMVIRPNDGDRLRAVVPLTPAGTKAWYAVSPLVDGRPLMSHPLVPATSTEEAPSPTVDADFDWKSNSVHTCGITTGEITFTFTEPFSDLSEYEITVGGEVTAGSLQALHRDIAKKTINLEAGQQLIVTAKARNTDGDWGPLWTKKFDTECERETAVVLAMGLNSSLVADGSHEPILRSEDCPAGPSGKDGFSRLAAANACDAQDDPTGNLISYLESKGYRYGDSLKSPSRTILEFSYKGAVVSCGNATSGPTLVPNPYPGWRTATEIINDVNHSLTNAATVYVDRLKQYGDCWKQHTGRELTYSIIGHSLGGYEALAMGAEADAKGYKGLISSIVTVDGAIQPHVITLELEGGCFTNDITRRLPADVVLWGLGKTGGAVNWTSSALVNGFDWDIAADRIRAAQHAGAKVATVTNYYDGCMSQNATINDAADDTEIFHVDYGVTGVDKHVAVLQAHGPKTTQPGYPLAAYLDNGWVPQATVLAPRAASTARASLAVTGALHGRVMHPETGLPVGAGQVVAVGGDDRAVYTSVSPDGRFSFDALTAGNYRLFVHSFADGVRGTWVGGPTLEQAKTFSVATGNTEVGDVAGIAVPRVTVRLTGTDGGPITDGVAVLADAENRLAASGRPGGDGTVTLTAPPGTYDLAAASPSTAVAVTKVNLSEPADVSLELEPAAVVTATVKDESGAPLPSVAAVLYSGEDVVAAGFTGGDGTVRLAGLEPGDYTVKLYEVLDRFELPEVVRPVTAVIGDPTAGQVSYTLDQAVVITSGVPPADAIVGEPYTFTFAASGSPTPTFSLSSGQLPDGLTLDAGGKLSGAPTTAGTFTFSVTATNPAGTATGGPYTITVDAKPAITSSAPPAGSIGVPYDFALTASGAPAPTFALASGALPDGLALDQDGRLHGTPTREGRYTFTVSAQNRAGSATVGPYTVAISTPPAVSQVVSLDQKTPAVQFVSPAMPVSAGELVLVHVSADGPPKPRQEVTAVTGGGLVWSLAARSNTGRGTAEIWQAYSAQTISRLRVTAKLARTGYDGSITVASLKGARQVVGATATAAGSKAAPTVAATPTQDGSLIWAVGHDATRAQAPTPLSGQSIVHQFLDTRAKDTFWTQRLSNPASKGATVRMGASAPTGDQWQFVAVEVTPVAP